MWKKITVVAGGMALALALPFVALAVTIEEFPDVIAPADATPVAVQAATQAQPTSEVAPAEPTGPGVSPNAIEPIATQQADQMMVRQRLRVHAETGPPEGLEPVQQRLHTDDPLGTGPGNENAGNGQNRQNHQNQNEEMVKGNPDAPMARAGTGDPEDCPHDEQPQGGRGGNNGGTGGRSG